MKAVVAAFNQEKALVGAFSVITNLRMELFGALATTLLITSPTLPQVADSLRAETDKYLRPGSSRGSSVDENTLSVKEKGLLQVGAV